MADNPTTTPRRVWTVRVIRAAPSWIQRGFGFIALRLASVVDRRGCGGTDGRAVSCSGGCRDHTAL